MAAEKSFLQEVEAIKNSVTKLPDTFSPDQIEETAVRLEGLNYAPSVITPNKQFLRLSRQAMLDEIDRVLAMPEEEACALAPGDEKKCNDLRLQFIRVIAYYYEKLILLRQGNAEEWDEIDELYVHD